MVKDIPATKLNVNHKTLSSGQRYYIPALTSELKKARTNSCMTKMGTYQFLLIDPGVELEWSFSDDDRDIVELLTCGGEDNFDFCCPELSDEFDKPRSVALKESLDAAAAIA